MKANPHAVFGINNHGRDYFVGDIHGRYDRLMKTLKAMRFDMEKDRLFSVGDLVDRGYENEKVIELLDEPWFHACFGNHEELFVSAILNPENEVDVRNHIQNGGGWAWEQNDDAKFGVSPKPEAMAQVHKVLEKCHFMMTVETKNGRIGVIHADCPRVWPNADDNVTYNSALLWARSKPKEAVTFGDYAQPHEVLNVDAVVHGHESHHEIIRNANRVWIDTADYGEFTIFRDEELIVSARRQLQKHRNLRVNSGNPWMTP